MGFIKKKDVANRIIIKTQPQNQLELGIRAGGRNRAITNKVKISLVLSPGREF